MGVCQKDTLTHSGTMTGFHSYGLCGAVLRPLEQQKSDVCLSQQGHLSADV